MKVIDLHCDVLYKLAGTEEGASFKNSEQLDVNLEKLKKGGVKAQVFAIFVDDHLNETQRYMEALRQVEKFQYEVIAPFEEMVHITNWQQLEQLEAHQIGAILSLEGCDAIGDSMEKLQSFIDAGILLAGLTWNHENAVAYGANEDATKGLKPFGYEVVQKLNDANIIVDVSHLNEQGFWDVLKVADRLIASHSNAYAIRPHQRNLKDDQIKALIEHGGHMHCVFYPLFIKESEQVTMTDLIEHIQHIANLVGADKIGLGSDFDGIDQKVIGLENASQYPMFLELLKPHFTEIEIEGIAANNFERFISVIE